MIGTFPRLASPFPRAINSHAERLQAVLDRWVDSYQVITNPNAAKRFRAAKLGWVTARMYPYAAYEDLEVAGKCMTLLDLNDDAYDTPDTGDATTIDQQPLAYEAYLDILHGTALPTTHSKMCAMLADLRDQLKPRMPAASMAHFIDHIDFYLTGERQMAIYTIHASVPDLVAYIPLRERTIGIYLCIDLIDLSQPQGLPEDMYSHTIVRQLAWLTACVIAYSNDIYSLKREEAAGCTVNLIPVLEHTFSLSREQALERAIGMHDHAVAEFVARKAQLPSFGPANDALLQRYVTGLEFIMSGIMDWAQETVRY